MSLKVLHLDDPGERTAWCEAWNHLPSREAFAHPGYVSLFADDGSRGCAALWTRGDDLVLLPFLLRDIRVLPFCPTSLGPATDIVGPYGYGGAFCRQRDGSLKATEFWSEFDEWALEQGVVSEFMRLSLFGNEVLDLPGEIEERQLNVVRELVSPLDEIWSQCEHKVRKNVKRAQEEGVEVRIDERAEHLPEFMRVYRETMERRRLGNAYRFSTAFFERLTSLDGLVVLFHAFYRARVVSSEVVLVSANRVYSFLGGTLEDAFDVRPNDLLKFEIIRWAKDAGKQAYVLGGGYEPGDGVFRYKRSFAPDGCVPFLTGKRILRPDAYRALQTAHSHALTASSGHDDGYFPAYRR